MEFDTWATPFSEGEIHIVDLHWGARDWWIEYADGKRYETKAPFESENEALLVSIFHRESETVYLVTFEYPIAFRLLDEHGLVEVWAEKQTPANCLKVKGHGWSKESAISFAMGEDGWSHIIATGDECVEVVCSASPKVELKERLKAKITKGGRE